MKARARWRSGGWGGGLGGRLGLILWAVVAGAWAQPVVLNELVALNETGLEDEDGDRPDWIELFNPGTAAINLAGYGLSDDRDWPFKWVFPRVIIPSRGYLLVFASGKDRTNAAARLHANFSIRAAGERVGLTRPDRVLVSEVPGRSLPRDVSLGRAPDGGTNLVLLAAPTPGQANPGSGGAGVAAAPEVAERSGHRGAPFLLRPPAGGDPSAVLRFTLDGSEPGPGSSRWGEPILVVDRSPGSNVLAEVSTVATTHEHTDGWKPPAGPVAKAMVVRVRAFREGDLPSPVVTRTFFVGTNHPGRFRLPVVALATDPRGLFDYDTGIYVLGRVFDAWRAAHPGETINGHTPANYQQRGPDWERPAHLEYFPADGTPALAREVRLEIRGQSSRSFRQKSLGVRFLGEALAGEIFPGLTARGTGQPLRRFGRLRLGNSGNDWPQTMFRDALCHRLVEHGPVDTLAYQPCVVFLNGEFWGLHNLREEQDGAYLEAHYGVPRGELVIAEGEGDLLEGRPGDEASFRQLRAYAATNDLTIPAHYAEVGARMDLDNFIRYQAAEIYFGNADWPRNNIRFWRRRTAGRVPGAAPGHDGRWRWLLYDTDLSYGYAGGPGYGDNTLAWAMDPRGRPPIEAPWSTLLLRSLLTHPGFRRDFINTLADLLNREFREDRAAAVISAMAEAIAPVIPEHIHRWRTMQDSPAGWTNQVRALRLFASQRPINVRQHVVTAFRLEGYAPLTVEVTPARGGNVRVNSLRLEQPLPGAVPGASPYPWKGIYFKGVPVELEARPAPGFRFVRWADGEDGAAGPRRELAVSGPRTVTAVFEPDPPRLVDWRVSAGGGWSVAVQGPPGSRWQLEGSPDLDRWQAEGSLVLDATGAVRVGGQLPPGETVRFLRLRAE